MMQTEIYRRVFHAIPDDTVTTWKQYKHFCQAKTSPSPAPPSLGESQGHSSNPRCESVEELHGRDEKDSERSQTASVPKFHHVQEKEPDKGKGARGPQPCDKADWAEMENSLKHVRGHLGKASRLPPLFLF